MVDLGKHCCRLFFPFPLCTPDGNRSRKVAPLCSLLLIFAESCVSSICLSCSTMNYPPTTTTTAMVEYLKATAAAASPYHMQMGGFGFPQSVGGADLLGHQMSAYGQGNMRSMNTDFR